MILPYQQFRNTSGKLLQMELRLSDGFNFAPNELITILYPGEAEHRTGNVPGFIVHKPSYVGNHQAYETGWISETSLAENFTLEPYPVFKFEKEMFNYVWETRPHKSQLTGLPLYPIGNMLWFHQFLHILPKGTYKHWKLNPYNILLARPDEHDIQERYPYFLEVRQALTLEYHTKYK